MKIITFLAGLLLVTVCDPGTARAGACAGPRYSVFVTVDGGRALQRNRPVVLRYGLRFSSRASWPDCRPRVRPVSAPAELSWSPSRRGPWTRLARGRDRQLRWTPTRLGLTWLRVQATDRYKKRHTHIAAVIVGQGMVRPKRRFLGYRWAQLWVDGRPTDLVLMRAPPSAPNPPLPRTRAWWLLKGPRYATAWARVTRAGKVRVTPAPARLRVRIGDILRRGWQVWIHHAGMPRVPTLCGEDCYLKHLPAGPVKLMVRPATTAQKPRTVSLKLKRSGLNPTVLSAMHLLARKTQPARQQWPLLGNPTLRGKPRRGACDNARPFDGPRGVVALGRALCRRSKKGKAWVVGLQPPGILARGPATAPVARGKRIYWAESDINRHSKLGRVLLYVAASTGVMVEQIPLRQAGRAHALAVTQGGDVYVVGAGYVAVRGKGGWKIHRQPSTLRAVAVHGRTVWASSRYGLIRCAGRCRKGPRSVAPLTGFVTRGGKLRVVARSGALFAIGRRRLRRVQAKPTIDLRLTRIVSARRSTFGLFGPAIAGSEYHPYCVGSVVARLTPGGWSTVHRVGGRRGRTLDCQDDDRRPPVVVDLAVAGQTVYARRRARKAGLLPGYKPLHRIKAPAPRRP